MSVAQSPSANHEFGSSATELKLSLVEDYSRAFTTALQGRFSELWFIDAFAGTGQRTERRAAITTPFFSQPEKLIQHRGSARIAIDVDPPFDRLVFVEKRRNAVAALHALRNRHPDRSITVIKGDANDEIPTLIKSVNWRSKRAILFLDPFGMTVDWSTLTAIADTRAIDVWYLFSLSGLYRQATRDVADIDDSKRTAINRVLGTEKWQETFYEPRRRAGLFFDETERLHRAAGVRELESYVRDRLKTIFPEVLPPFALPRQGPQLFSLFFAVSNDSPAALGLAKRIANHILKAGMSSQFRPR